MRLNGTTKFMVVNHLVESVAEAMTIRAFQEEDCFFDKNLNLVDTNASQYFHNFATTEWLIQRIEILGAIVLAAVVLCIVMLPRGTFSSGFIGYALTLSMAMVFSILDTPPVLQGISYTFEGGDKIDIVGRTGSGKTTLIGALFRLVEPVGGNNIVDGVDIGFIGLHDLRSHLGIIPQDLTLFNGSVRFNLDPLCQDNDEKIWDVMTLLNT
ncbi:ABC transporter C family member 10 [Bienertia sinuspersici]